MMHSLIYFEIAIERFLRGSGCGWLWEVVKDDSAVMDEGTGLARSPLMLAVLVLASDGWHEKALEGWLGEDYREKRQWLLFRSYIDRQLERRYVGRMNSPRALQIGTSLKMPYQDEAKVRRWLGWLARRFRETGQTEIFIEKLQPSFLSMHRQRCVYGLIYGLFSGSFIVLPLWL